MSKPQSKATDKTIKTLQNPTSADNRHIALSFISNISNQLQISMVL
jgi:hypothetical protein